MIRLFDVQGKKVVPTEHCYIIQPLRAIMEAYPDEEEHMAIFAYLFYMTCPNPDLNPFFDLPEAEKENYIYLQLDCQFSVEDPDITIALDFCKKLYQTPTYRAFMGIKVMLDRLAEYMYNTPVSHGRDGNISQLVSTATKFNQIRESYKGAFKDLQEEISSTVRGGQKLAYDQ